MAKKKIPLKVEWKYVPVSEVELNEGQIPGVPKNPRVITKKNWEKLGKSMDQDPEMEILKPAILYPHNGKLVAIGGNQKTSIHIDREDEEMWAAVIMEKLPAKKLRMIALKDNSSYGKNDDDILANEFEVEELVDANYKIPDPGGKEEKGVMEWSTEIDRASNYVVLLFHTDIDFIHAKSLLGLESTYSRRQNGKPWSKGIGRVIDGVEAIKKIQEG